MPRRDRSERCADILNLYTFAYRAVNPKAKFLHCANGPCNRVAHPHNNLFTFFCSEKCRDQFWRDHTFED